MEEIEIFDVESGEFRTCIVDSAAAQYIEALEDANKILSFQKDAVSSAALDVMEEINVITNVHHETHYN